MITPRQTRLYRVPNLRAFQRTIRRLTDHSDILRLRSCGILVPSAAAADQLRRTFENHLLPATVDRALCLPLILTRSGWYDEMYARMASPPRRLNDLEREVLMKAAAREIADSEKAAPFRLRAGLLVEMLGLYDDLRRRDVSIDTFERLLTTELERDADIDRGAERLLRQTRFLAAAFRGYEARRDASGGVDEYALREHLLQAEPARPLRHVVVTVGDRTVDPSGLWPADYDLLTRLPLLEQVDIVATDATIAAGLLDRLQKFLPGFEEAVLVPEDTVLDHQAASSQLPASSLVETRTLDVTEQPVLMVPSDGQLFSVSRDREDELSAIAGRLKIAGSADLDRRAVVFKRPLPYVYLARDVFADAAIPYQTFDALPLAAEPYAAALDLVFEFVTSAFTREPVIALLGSPHFRFEVDGRPIGRLDVAALNRALSDAGYCGGADRLREFAFAAGRANGHPNAQSPRVGPALGAPSLGHARDAPSFYRGAAAGRTARAARAAATAAEELRLLADTEKPSAQLGALLAFLAAHDRIPPVSDPLRERHLRARSAIIAAIQRVRRAHQQLDDSPVPLVEVAAMLRRWIEGQTFAPRAGASGVQVIDAQAARYGEFDEIFLVGLVEGEWPQHSVKSIFYPQWLLAQLDWPDSKAALAGERAAFEDLIALPRRQVHLSSFELENDSIIGPSVFLEDIDRVGFRQIVMPAKPSGRMFVHEGLTSDPIAYSAVSGEAADWLRLRAARSESSGGQFHGTATPHKPAAYTVSSLERYLECPFRFFADRVLELKEDPEDEATLTPKELGIFVHQVFHAFFAEWNRRSQRAITPENISEARSLFCEVVEPLLATLADDEAAIQRTRLLGSAADEGLAEAVFQIEAEWQTPVLQRLLEHPLNGEFEITTEKETRRVGLKGKADRIDLLADGRFRVIDYKLGRSPDRKLALQLPIYTICAVQHLRETTGQDWEPGQAGYIAFGGDRRFVPMLGRGKTKDATLQEAQTRLLATIDAIERGEFPPRPADVMLCARCSYVTVCRKDYVGDV